MSTRGRKPIPKNQSEIVQSTISPYLSQGKPISDSVFSRPANRAIQTTRKTDKIKDISVGLEDIDGAIKFYFDDIIRPVVTQDGNQINVPVMYGSPERWKSVQANGYYRDTNGKLVLPLIMYKRENIEKNRNLGNKIDGNLASLFQVFETKYSSRNAYDAFSILNNRVPSKQYYVTVVPDYVTITYNCVILTNYVEQNNKIIEAVEFAADSYWGDKNRWQFRTMIDSFATTNVINTGEDRVATTTLTLKVNGYLIPDTVNKTLSDSHLHYSPAQVVFGIETVGDVNENFVANSQIASSQASGQTSFVGGGVNVTNNNVVVNISGSAVLDGDLVYLNTNNYVSSSVVTSGDTVIFPNRTIIQPPPYSSIPPTSITNFSIFVNGQYVGNNNVISINQVGSDVVLIVNTGSLNYSFNSTDEILVVGKIQ